MSGIITKGYGAHNLIITMGYGLWERIKEIVREIITRVWPKKRVPFKTSIKVTGDVSFPLKKEVPVLGDLIKEFRRLVPIKGKKDLSDIMKIILEDEDEEVDGKKEEKLSGLASKIRQIDSLMEELAEAEKKKDRKRVEEITKRFEEIIKDDQK